MRQAGLDAGVVLVGALAVVLLTGAVLGLAYSPTPSAAHGSVVAAPWFLRAAHAWAASVALCAALVACVRHAVGSGAWGRRVALAGVGVVAALVFAFESGAVLAWDQRGWETFLHVREAVGLVGVRLGDATDPGATPLGLFFGVHLLLGLAAAASAIPLARRVFAGGARRRIGVVATAGVFAIILLSLFAPPFLGPEPVAGVAASRPHWPFVWVAPLQRMLGPVGLLALPVLVATAFGAAWWAAAWPVGRRRRLAWTGLVVLGALTAWGWFAPG